MIKLIIIVVIVLICLLTGIYFAKSKNLMSEDKTVSGPPPMQFDTLEAALGVEAVSEIGVKITPESLGQDNTVKALVSYKEQSGKEYEFKLNEKLQTSYGSITLRKIRSDSFSFDIQY